MPRHTRVMILADEVRLPAEYASDSLQEPDADEVKIPENILLGPAAARNGNELNRETLQIVQKRQFVFPAKRQKRNLMPRSDVLEEAIHEDTRSLARPGMGNVGTYDGGP